jgi:hypothetical protein
MKRLEALGYQTYEAYLKSDHWQRVRRLKFARNGARCEECGGRSRLEVHHLSYDRLGRERLEDLKVLCRACHASAHGLGADQYHAVVIEGEAVREYERTRGAGQRNQRLSKPERKRRAREAKQLRTQKPQRRDRLAEENDRLHRAQVRNREHREEAERWRGTSR